MISFASSERVYTCSLVKSTYHMYFWARAEKMMLKITTTAMKAMVKAVAADPYLNFLELKMLFLFILILRPQAYLLLSYTRTARNRKTAVMET